MKWSIDASQRKKCALTSDRKIEANRANARASTGPKTARGPRSRGEKCVSSRAEPARSFDPALSEEVEALAREIAGTDASAKTLNSRAMSQKRRSICAACVRRAIDSCPGAILTITSRDN